MLCNDKQYQTLAGSRGVGSIMESFSKIMILEETAKYSKTGKSINEF